MRRLISWSFFLLMTAAAAAQSQDSLTLQQCLQSADAHYPLARQTDLIRQNSDLLTRKINTGYLPQLALNAQVTHQSDVVSIPLEIPMLDIPMPDKTQYKATVDVNQVIYDGGAIASRKDIQAASAGAELQSLEVKMHQVKTQVSQVFFSIKLTQQQLQLVALGRETLSAQLSRTQSAVKHGVVLPMEADVLSVELIRNNQQMSELRQQLVAQVQILQELTGLELDTSVALALPQPEIQPSDLSVEQRPEIALLDQQKKVQEEQQRLISAGRLPHLGAFAQLGYGKPGLNPLENEFAPFYIAGLKFNWNIWDWNASHIDRQVIEINRQKIDLERQTFEINTNTELYRHFETLQTLESQLQADEQIVQLQEKIAQASSDQLNRGVATASDYIVHFNALQQAQLTFQLHQIQLAKAKVDLALAQGKFQ